MPPKDPRRTEVWTLLPDDDGESYRVMVVSSDAWNRKDVDSVLILYVYDVDPAEAAGPYETLFRYGSESLRVDASVVEPMKRSRFDRVEPFRIQGAVLTAVEDQLRAVFTGSAGRTPLPGSHPRAGQFRWADLLIEGEPTEKPVLIVSSDEYAVATDMALLVCCRTTSRSGQPHEFEVPLEFGSGLVVCSDVRTIDSSQVKARSFSKPAVSPAVREAVMERLQAVLGL